MPTSPPPSAARVCFPHVCSAECGVDPARRRREPGLIVRQDRGAAVSRAAERPPLPAALTLRAPAALSYAALLDALSAARVGGVKRARVIVEM